MATIPPRKARLPAFAGRKHPQQARAQKTVQRILAAARELVAAHGIDALTTNRIADAAHVNIATLYQYFPNKEAVLDALLAVYMAEITTALDLLLGGLDERAGIEDSTRAWTMGSMLYFRQTQGVLPELMRAGGGNLMNLPALKQMENRLIEAMRRFLMRRREQLDVPNLDAAVYVAFHAASSVITRHLLEPDWMRNEEIVEELVRLMMRYFGVRQAPASEMVKPKRGKNART
jgi:AcrR family transcriptional regulator